MPWMKIDDSFESHPKVKSIPKGKRTKAIGLWTLAGSWCARHLTDGFVPSYMVVELGGTRAESSLLVSASLWREVDGGFAFHDWTDHQPSRAKVEEERGAARERMRSARERKKGVSSQGVRANDSERSGADAENFANGSSVTPTRPDPTRPIEEPSSDQSDAMDRFDEFWDAYGKKTNRKAAEGKWRLALKRKGVTPELLISAARAYVTYERQNNEGGRFIMDPARWLNGHRWEDERPTNVTPLRTDDQGRPVLPPLPSRSPWGN